MRGQTSDADGDQLHGLGIVIDDQDFQRVALGDREQPEIDERPTAQPGDRLCITAAAPSVKPGRASATMEMMMMDAAQHRHLRGGGGFPAVHLGQHDVEGDQR